MTVHRWISNVLHSISTYRHISSAAFPSFLSSVYWCNLCHTQMKFTQESGQSLQRLTDPFWFSFSSMFHEESVQKVKPPLSWHLIRSLSEGGLEDSREEHTGGRLVTERKDGWKPAAAIFEPVEFKHKACSSFVSPPAGIDSMWSLLEPDETEAFSSSCLVFNHKSHSGLCSPRSLLESIFLSLYDQSWCIFSVYEAQSKGCSCVCSRCKQWLLLARGQNNIAWSSSLECHVFFMTTGTRACSFLSESERLFLNTQADLVFNPWNTHPASVSCLCWQHICLFFSRPLQQISAATQHAGDVRQTHAGSNATLQIRRLTDFFHKTHAVLG